MSMTCGCEVGGSMWIIDDLAMLDMEMIVSRLKDGLGHGFECMQITKQMGHPATKRWIEHTCPSSTGSTLSHSTRSRTLTS